jgi:hypothetical protein
MDAKQRRLRWFSKTAPRLGRKRSRPRHGAVFDTWGLRTGRAINSFSCCSPSTAAAVLQHAATTLQRAAALLKHHKKSFMILEKVPLG